MNVDSTQAMLKTVEAFKARLNEKDKSEGFLRGRATIPAICVVSGALIGATITLALMTSGLANSNDQRVPIHAFDWAVLEISANRDILPHAARRLFLEKINQAQ